MRFLPPSVKFPPRVDGRQDLKSFCFDSWVEPRYLVCVSRQNTEEPRFQRWGGGGFFTEELTCVRRLRHLRKVGEVKVCLF